MKTALAVIASFRQFCELSAVLVFVFYWPLLNSYWLVSGTLLAIGSTNPALEIVAAIGIFMMFLVPFWALAFIGTYYLSIPLAVASFRPVPLVLCAVAWLEHAGSIPSGHLSLPKPNALIGNDSGDWVYPLLYSVLAILGGTLVALQSRHTKHAR
jgi:hypothetical protein